MGALFVVGGHPFVDDLTDFTEGRAHVRTMTSRRRARLKRSMSAFCADLSMLPSWFKVSAPPQPQPPKQ